MLQVYLLRGKHMNSMANTSAQIGKYKETRLAYHRCLRILPIHEYTILRRSRTRVV